MPDIPEHFSQTVEEFVEENSIEDMPDAYIALLDKFIELVEDGKILDAGCGHGKDVEYFIENGLDAVGIDVSTGMIEYARENMEGEYHVMDVRNLEFEDEAFEGVWCNTVMQFLAPGDMETAVQEFNRVLEPDGVFYVTFKLGDGTIMTEQYGDEIERNLVSRDRAEAIVREHGFKILETHTAELNGLEVMNLFARKVEE